MTRMKKDYDDAMARATTAIVLLQKALEDHKANRGSQDYGEVGDLCHVNRQLCEVLAGFNGYPENVTDVQDIVGNHIFDS